MLDRNKYLAVCGTLLMLLAGIAGCWVGMQIKPTPIYVYLKYDTVSNSKSMKELLDLSGIKVNDDQWECFVKNIKPKN